MNAWWISPRGYAPLGDDPPLCRAYAPEASCRAGANEKPDRKDVAIIAAPQQVSTD